MSLLQPRIASLAKSNVALCTCCQIGTIGYRTQEAVMCLAHACKAINEDESLSTKPLWLAACPVSSYRVAEHQQFGFRYREIEKSICRADEQVHCTVLEVSKLLYFRISKATNQEH